MPDRAKISMGFPNKKYNLVLDGIEEGRAPEVIAENLYEATSADQKSLFDPKLIREVDRALVQLSKQPTLINNPPNAIRELDSYCANNESASLILSPAKKLCLHNIQNYQPGLFDERIRQGMLDNRFLANLPMGANYELVSGYVDNSGLRESFSNIIRERQNGAKPSPIQNYDEGNIFDFSI